MPDYTVLDLLKTTSDGKPQEFKTAFDDVMKDKIAQAIDNKKDEIAASMFGQEQENDGEEIEYDNDEELELDDGEELELDLEAEE